MPKYPRRRLNDGSNGPTSFPGIPLMPPVYGFPALPMNFMPPPALPIPFPPPPPPPPSMASGIGAPIEPMRRPDTVNSKPKISEKRDLPKYCKEGLVSFDEELKLLEARNPTDLVIIDLDSALLQIPELSHELFSLEARKAIGRRLDRHWPYNRVMLEAMIGMGRWDPAIIEIARDASKTEKALLVITTRWRQSDISLIRSALKNEGVEHIDHFACPYTVTESDAVLDHVDDDADTSVGADADADADATADADVGAAADATADAEGDGPREDGRYIMYSKSSMFELLLDSYESLERVSIFEGSSAHCKRYRRCMNDFVRYGILNEEAFYIPEITPRPMPSISLSTEKQLVDKVLEQSKVPMETSTVVIEWVYKLTERAQQSLVAKLVSVLGEELWGRFHLDDIPIVQGKLPPDMRALIPPSGTTVPMSVTGYKIKKHSLYLKLDNASSLMLKVATFNRDVKVHDQETSLIPAAIDELAESAQDSELYPDLKPLQQLGGFRIETLVYERRQFRAAPSRSRR